MARHPEDLVRSLFGGAAIGRPPTEHPDEESLAALLECATPEQADPRIVEHLASCDQCRREWLDLRGDAERLGDLAETVEPPWELERVATGALAREGVAQPTRRGFRPGYRLLLGTAAALVLAGVALLVPWDRTGDRDTLRSQPTAVRSLNPLEPAGAIRPGEPPTFRWTAAPGATAYELVVAEASTGETVLRARVMDTEHRLSEQEASRLLPGREYRWLVRAERGRGRSQTGPAAAFSVSSAP
jgi:hypothetical protein